LELAEASTFSTSGPTQNTSTARAHVPRGASTGSRSMVRVGGRRREGEASASSNMSHPGTVDLEPGARRVVLGCDPGHGPKKTRRHPQSLDRCVRLGARPEGGRKGRHGGARAGALDDTAGRPPPAATHAARLNCGHCARLRRGIQCSPRKCSKRMTDPSAAPIRAGKRSFILPISLRGPALPAEHSGPWRHAACRCSEGHPPPWCSKCPCAPPPTTYYAPSTRSARGGRDMT
jgi:hypothetical protein